VRLTLEKTPKGATHWSSRMLAARTGLSQSTISRIWRAFGLKPHRTESFQLSTDPLLIDKVRDIVGLYLDPPHHALVLCVDEKSQIQALSRTQPVLPMRAGQQERRTHDYKRHGVTSLFAALDIATGSVLGKCYRRHRSVEFLDFLKKIDSAVPVDLDIHLQAAAQGDAKPFDINAFERDALARIGMPAEIVMRHRPTHFQHVFAGSGYAAAYYSYMWSEVLDADAFAAFEEAGDIFDAGTAKNLRDHVYAAGGSRDPVELYTAFRGRLPTPDGLLRRRGLSDEDVIVPAVIPGRGL